jgi:hypothetical protein
MEVLPLQIVFYDVDAPVLNFFDSKIKDAHRWKSSKYKSMITLIKDMPKDHCTISVQEDPANTPANLGGFLP